MKKTILLSLTMIIVLSFSVPSAFAGSKQRHQWQGAAMAIGAVILGNAILNSGDYDSSPRYSATVDRYRPGRHHYNACPPPRHRQGHWECKKVWVDPVYERVWNPGHYNAYHQWVPGEYIMIEQKPGCWATKKVWVGCR